MPAQRHVFTSESVTEGHPDKIADQISDAVLDAIIAKDPDARVACETLVTTGMAVIAGEITTSTYVHIPDIVRGTIASIGYTDANFGFDAQTCAVLTTIPKHSDKIDNKEIRAGVIALVVRPVLAEAGLEVADPDVYVNPTGRFVVGGPQGDAGLTGRKIIVDTYGGMARHGGGAFSGKDPSKVDRSACYAMRWVAKNIVAAKLAKRCETQVAYAIGVADPVSVMVDTFGTGVVPDEALEDAVREVFDLQPRGIIEALSLRNPIYRSTAAYGHFGRTPERRRFVDPDVTKDVEWFTWERLNRVEDLRLAVQRSRHYQAAKTTA